MSQVEVVGTGTSIDLVVANVREQLDAQLGAGKWALVPEWDPEDDGDFGSTIVGGNPRIEMQLSPGGNAVQFVKVTMYVVGERDSTRALPRAARG